MTSIEMTGTLGEDGIIVLDEKPSLPPGRVKVIVQPFPDLTRSRMHQFFKRIQEERRALGVAAHTTAEIDAFLATMRDDNPNESPPHQETP